MGVLRLHVYLSIPPLDCLGQLEKYFSREEEGNTGGSLYVGLLLIWRSGLPPNFAKNATMKPVGKPSENHHETIMKTRTLKCWTCDQKAPSFRVNVLWIWTCSSSHTTVCSSVSTRVFANSRGSSLKLGPYCVFSTQGLRVLWPGPAHRQTRHTQYMETQQFF